jgi:hypothetical protein
MPYTEDIGVSDPVPRSADAPITLTRQQYEASTGGAPPDLVPTRDTPDPRNWTRQSPLDTSYEKLPTRDDPGGRIWQATKEAFESAPSLGTDPGNMSVITRPAQKWLSENVPVVGPAINLAGAGLGYGLGGAAAIGQGVASTAGELAGYFSGNPAAARDVSTLLQVAPLADRPVPNYMPKVEGPMPGPKIAPGIGPRTLADVGERQYQRNVTPGLLGLPPATGPSSPTGIQVRIPPSGLLGPEHLLAQPFWSPEPGPTFTQPTRLPTSAAELKQIAQTQYDTINAKANTMITPSGSNGLVDAAEKAFTPQYPTGLAISGTNPGTDAITGLQALRDRQVSLGELVDADQQLTKQKRRQTDAQSASDIGDIQTAYRNGLDNLTAGDISGGNAGFEALQPALQGWKAYRKAATLEDIRDDANLPNVKDPAAYVRQRLTTMLKNDKQMAPYDTDERAAIRDASATGNMQGAINLIGKKVLPAALTLGAGLFGLKAGGGLGAGVGAGLGIGGGGFLNATTNAITQRMQMMRLQNAINTIAKGAPPPAQF